MNNSDIDENMNNALYVLLHKKGLIFFIDYFKKKTICRNYTCLKMLKKANHVCFVKLLQYLVP